jgi:hypothetical protein
MGTMETPMSIPASLAPFFQEYDLVQIDLERSRFTIIERVLQFGDRQEIRWLFTVYHKQTIMDWVSRWGGEALGELHRSFRKLVLEIPELINRPQEQTMDNNDKLDRLIELQQKSNEMLGQLGLLVTRIGYMILILWIITLVVMILTA